MISRARGLLALVPESVKGRFDYHCQPGLAAGFGPLNGQRLRQRMIANLLNAADAACIVETGTYRGSSTVFFSEFGLPVFTVESNARYYAHSKIRLRKLHNVTVAHRDSVVFLRDKLPQQTSRDEVILFYLDAHWYARLPTRHELAIIFRYCKNNVIVIVDFGVPGDPGYGFDHYGNGESLNVDYLRNVTGAGSIMVFFPASHSSEETGARRGSCVLTSKSGTRRPLAGGFGHSLFRGDRHAVAADRRLSSRPGSIARPLGGVAVRRGLALMSCSSGAISAFCLLGQPYF